MCSTNLWQVELAALRADRSYWDFLAFAPTGDAESWKDENYRLRFRVVISLQYDLELRDGELLRYVFDQETLYVEESPYQGLTEALQVSGWLLAQQAELDDVPRFIRAKNANFDTYCGFAIEHVFSTGYDETIAWLQGRALRDSVEAEILEKCELNQTLIDQWFERQREKYPEDPERETLRTQVRRYTLLGRDQEALEALNRWENESTRTPTELSTFRYWYSQLAQRGCAMRLCREVLQGEISEWLRASETCTLIGLLREEERTAEAWELILKFVGPVREDSDKAEARLTFHLLSEVWELALLVGPRKREIFELGCELQAALSSIPLAVREKGELAATLYGTEASSQS